VSRYNADRKQIRGHPIVILLTVLVQCRGTNLKRSQEFIKVQDFNCVQMRVSGCNGHYEFVLGAVSGKNHDELINFDRRC
jgi:hypothetical protein